MSDPTVISSRHIRPVYDAALGLLAKPAAIRVKVLVREGHSPGLQLGEGIVVPLWLADKYGLLEAIGATKARAQVLIAKAVVALNRAHAFDRDDALDWGTKEMAKRIICLRSTASAKAKP